MPDDIDDDDEHHDYQHHDHCRRDVDVAGEPDSWVVGLSRRLQGAGDAGAVRDVDAGADAPLVLKNNYW